MNGSEAKPNLVVNCRFLCQQMTGVQRFAGGICRELKTLVPSAMFVSPNNIQDTKLASELGVRVVGGWTGHLWEQVTLPWFLWRSGQPLLLNLCNTGPVRYRPQCVTLHDIAFLRYPESYSWWFRVGYRLLMPLLLKRARGVITVSDFSKTEICTEYHINAGSVTVVPNAVETGFGEIESAVPVSSERYILAVSSPARHKNFERLIEAYSMWEGRETVQLWIVGASAGVFAPTRIEALSNGVQLLGRVTDEELMSLYSGAIGFVFPSLYEGFGIPPLEAQARGCPVVASRAASMPEVLRDSAILFDPHDVSDIKRAMSALLCDETRRAEWQGRGYRNVRRFNWSVSAQKIMEVVESSSTKV